MASVQDINQTSSYTGNAAIGGHIDAPVVIDDTPIQRFTTFKFYSDQAKWQQKQIDDATAAKQIARVTAFDISSPLTSYSSALKGNLKEVQDYIRANPNALVYSKDPGAYSELQNKIQKFDQLRQSATASDAVYAANKNAIDIEPDLNKKAYLQADLDTRTKELFAGGVDAAQNKVLASASPIKPDDFQIPETQLTKYDAITQLPNSDVVTQISFINPRQAMANAELAAAGVNKPLLDENSISFKSLSPERQQLERQKSKISGVQRQQLLQTTDSFNSMLKEFTAANPDTDITQIKGSPDGNTLTDIIKSANGYNDQIRQLNAFNASGKSKDPTGKVITDQFDLINVQDGLSPAELIFMQSMQKSKSPIWSEVDKKISETDNAIQLSAQAETKRNNLREDATRKYIANLPYEKQKAGAIDSAGKPIEFGNLIYGINTPSNTTSTIWKKDGTKVEGMHINNGVMIDKSGNPIDYTGDATVEASNLDNSIITEFNKYAGATKTNGNGEPTQTAATAQLKPDESGRFKLRMENGTIKGIQTTDGTYATADQFEHITLEAGQKGVTKYKKADPNYGKFDKPSGTTFDVVDPKTGNILLKGVTKEAADNAAKKGYQIK